MLSYNNAFYNLKNSLTLYDAQEAAAIAHEALEHITGLSKLQRLTDKDNTLSEEQLASYNQITASLVAGKPLQYALHTAWFMNRKFYVDENVLIPRPETEELVQWIIDDHQNNPNISILDIGTGSGCIPISLKLAHNNALVSSCDISEDALSVARKNATELNADIDLLHLDILNEKLWLQLPQFDVIVSNPPYIPINEKESLHTNVRDNEPGLALFVPDNDPLLFYRTIATLGKTHLKKNGTIYCELHVDYAVQTKAMFIEQGYTNTELRKDIHGNMRMLKAII